MIKQYHHGVRCKDMTLVDSNSECCTCGYKWATAQSGAHSCTTNLVETVREQAQRIEDLEAHLKEAKEILEASPIDTYWKECAANFIEQV